MAGPPFQGSRPERDRICAALVRLAADRGFTALTVDDLVDRSGVDDATFDHHFDSLEDCFAAAWEEVDVELRREMAVAFGRRVDWQDRLRDSLLAGMHYLASDERRARFYVAEVLYVSDEMRDRQHAAMARLSVAIDVGRENTEADRAPPAIATAISGAIWHRAHQLVQAGRAEDLLDEVPRFMYLAVLPYRGSAAAQEELDRA